MNAFTDAAALARSANGSDLARIAGGAITWQGDSFPPSVLATRPADSVSARYEFISTKQVIEMMAEEGYTVHSTAVRRQRNRVVSPVGAHVVDFRHPDAPEVHGTVPRVLFSNSHDGSRGAKVQLGAFRLICANGMVTGTTIATESYRHAGAAARDLVERMRALSRNTAPMFEQISRWSKRKLTIAEQHDFARRAIEVRWGAGAATTDEVLEVRRFGDYAQDLWTVLNRVQEATTRAPVSLRSASGMQRDSRPLQEIGANLKFNAALWAMAEEVSC